jgi:hypothetical protein
MAYKTAIALAMLAGCCVPAVAQSSDRDMFLKAYPLCFELYPDEASVEHRTCIEVSARYASGYEREQLSAAVQRHIEERKRAADAEEEKRKRAADAEERLRAQRDAAAAGNSTELEFKGIALGSAIATIEDTGRFSCRDPGSPIADRICSLKFNERETIAGVPIRVLALYYYSGKLETISIAFDEKYFSQVAPALSEKYGQGTVRSETLQNRMGATFENRILSWRRGQATLEVKRYSGKFDTSAVMYRSDFALQEFARRRKTSVKDTSKDL